MDKPESGVKKPKVFPFPGTVEVSGQKKAVEILFLAPIGILARGKDFLVQVGAIHVVELTLPEATLPLTAKMRVFKTYDRAGMHTDHMAELQFDNLTSEMKDKISKFNKLFGQK